MFAPLKPAVVALLAGALAAPLAAATGTPAGSAAFPTAAAQRAAVAAAAARGRPVGCGGGRGNAVALTFDDGPGPYTAQLLRELAHAGAHATFFLVGSRVASWPKLPQSESKQGAVGNHTWSHPALTRLPHWLVWLELAETQSVLSDAEGVVPRLFRPPYELDSPSIEATAHGLGLLEVLWDVDSRDDLPGATVRVIVRNVIGYLRPGAIVVMHDLNPRTVGAVPQILRAMARRGLRSVSIPELLALDPPLPRRGCPFAPVAGSA